LSLWARFFFETMRKADLDNFNKVWQDALTDTVYDDDSQISELHLYRISELHLYRDCDKTRRSRRVGTGCRRLHVTSVRSAGGERAASAQ
jgi:hypothetical protein